MKIKQLFLILPILFILKLNLLAEVPERVGWWKFDNSSDLIIAEPGYGVPLILVGSQTAVNGPENENGATLLGIGSYYKMTHSISPNSGETRINEYSLQYDFKITDLGAWRSFFQTTENNTGDADFFINPNGNIGVAAVGYSGISINPNEWYRLIISVKNGSQFNCYLDGNLVLKGTAQPVNGRFSLESQLLVFADEDGEDGPIYCSELAIWDKALTAYEALELGGFYHREPVLPTRIPYLQSPGQTNMTVCWHDTAETDTKVFYGLDSTNLNLETIGTSEIISIPFRWHTVKLTGLKPDTRYFYKVSSGNQSSECYSFRTLPDNDFKGKLRFIMLSDTHSGDTTMAGKIARQALLKVSELYGSDIENQITGIIHSGDIVVSGNSPDQYNKQFFMPLSSLTSHIPTMVVAGNHEVESPYFYQYLKVDELSVFPGTPTLNEKILQLRIGNSLFLGLNTNISNQYGTILANWLDSKLNETEKDGSIDFVFLFFHHPPYSELWDYTNTQDIGTAYARDVLLPIIKRYSKVQQLNYGHTHGFERGAIMSEKVNGDFRIICGGGSGGVLDPWSPGQNRDFNDITICISNYIFQILEIDISSHSYQSSVYSLGTLDAPINGELIDFWYKKPNQPAPNTPYVENVIAKDKFVQVNTSPFAGVDSLMTVQIQVLDSSKNSEIVLDTFVQMVNIYGIDSFLNPVDLNRDINIYQTNIPFEILPPKSCYFKTRYRDNNLKWSIWSKPYLFTETGIKDLYNPINASCSLQNFPNPFSKKTTFKYEMTEIGAVAFRIYDVNNKIIIEKNLGIKPKGIHTFDFTDVNLKNGIYFCEMISGNKREVITIVKVK
jgi:hypothetical protein